MEESGIGILEINHELGAGPLVASSSRKRGYIPSFLDSYFYGNDNVTSEHFAISFEKGCRNDDHGVECVSTSESPFMPLQTASGRPLPGQDVAYRTIITPEEAVSPTTPLCNIFF